VLVTDLLDRLLVRLDGGDLAAQKRIQLIHGLVYGNRCHCLVTSGGPNCKVRSLKRLSPPERCRR
jgi:hypothetical protein